MTKLITSLVEQSTIFMGNIPQSLKIEDIDFDKEKNETQNNTLQYVIINGVYISQNATSLEEVYSECQEILSKHYLFLHKEQFYPVHVRDIIAIEAYKDKSAYAEHHDHYKCKYIALIEQSDTLYSIINELKSYRMKKIAFFPSIAPNSVSQELYNRYPHYLLKRKGIYSIQSVFKPNRLLKFSPDSWKWDINIYKFLPHN